MTFSGADPTLLRRLGDDLLRELGPLLRRQASVALDVLERHDRAGAADRVATDLSGLAIWLEDAGADLRRRAGLVESAQQLHLWGAGFGTAVRRATLAEAIASTSAPYSGIVDADVARHFATLASTASADFAADFRRSLERGDPDGVVDALSRAGDLESEPWFEAAMAELFGDLGPRVTAGLVAELVSVPVQEYDEATLLALADAFAAATRGGLTWGASEVRELFDQGAVGAAQLLRGRELDRDFLRLVAGTIGFDEEAPSDLTGPGSLRHRLATGAELWQHVGTEAGDHRAVILTALLAHLDLAIEIFGDPVTTDKLLTTPWPIDGGAALGRLLLEIDEHGDHIDAATTDAIRRRTLTTQSVVHAEVPDGLIPALGAIAGRHLADLAFSLAVGPDATETTARPGIELAADSVIRILGHVAQDDAAFGELLDAYAGYVGDVVANPPEGLYEQHLRARADELGSITFALAYTDRDVRLAHAERITTERMSTVYVLGFLASTGTALLPGPFDIGASFAVERLTQNAERLEGDDGSLVDHHRWKERLLADLEYLIALEMARRGLLPGVEITDDRTTFLYAVEDADGPLEAVMTIIEAQARRQREAVDEMR